jgi:hypothetical protein
VFRTSSVAALGAAAGCLSTVTGSNGESPTATDTPTDTPKPPGEFVEWERSTDCDAMHDSVISVEGVSESRPHDAEPIHFANLAAAEQELLRPVTGGGG